MSDLETAALPRFSTIFGLHSPAGSHTNGSTRVLKCGKISRDCIRRVSLALSPYWKVALQYRGFGGLYLWREPRKS